MLSIDEVRKRKTRNTRTVTVVLDAEWGERFAQLEARAVELREMGMGAVGGAEWTKLNDELEQMRSEAPEHTIELRLKGISNDRYERILGAHPITPTQRATAKSRGDSPRPWDPDTFPPALLAVCLVDDVGEPWATEAEISELWHDDDAWNTADLVALFDAALEVCLTRPVIPSL